MKSKSTNFNLWVLLTVITVTINYAFASTVTRQDTSLLSRKTRSAKSSYLKNGLAFALPPLKPGVVSTTKYAASRPDDKLLTYVQVYPMPVSDQINLKYAVSRNTNVTIKIVDVLGNDLITIFSQRVETGEQKYSYVLNNKLSRGFYFVRVMAGTESTIKRFSIL